MRSTSIRYPSTSVLNVGAAVTVCLVTTGTAAAATYHVAPTGQDTNQGTLTSPFRTLQKAADVVNPGDVVIVDDGVYTDTDGNGVIAYLQRGGTPSAWVTFRSKNKWGAKLDGQNNLTKHGWHIDAPYIIVQDFDIYGQGDIGGDGFAVNSSNIQVAGNHIHDIGRQCDDNPYGLDGIIIGSVDAVTITQNVFHDIGRYSPGQNGCSPTTPYYQNQDHGIYVVGPSNVTIANNIFYNNVHGWSVHVYPSTVSNLEILNNTFASPNPYRVGHILLASDVSTAIIANNIFYQPTTAGIRYSNGTVTNVSVKNNMTYGGTILYNDTTPSPGMTLSGNYDNTDPRSVNPTAFDFHLQSSSTAIDAGASLTDVSIDFDGNRRPQGAGYDIGAYEYRSTSTSHPAAPTNLRIISQ